MEEKYYQAENVTTGRVIATRVKIAQDFRSRSVGLLNRTSFSEDEGLLIKPCNSIHTFFMKFPIDVLFLDKYGKIVRTVEGLVPWRFAGSLGSAYMVLELATGKIEKQGIKTGEIVKVS
jgi:uncharacterized membrane protein (UPF0127 family)